MRVLLIFLLVTLFGCNSSSPAPEPAPRPRFSIDQNTAGKRQDALDVIDDKNQDDEEPKKKKKKKKKPTDEPETAEVVEDPPREPELPKSTIEWDGTKSVGSPTFYLEPIE